VTRSELRCGIDRGALTKREVGLLSNEQVGRLGVSFWRSIELAGFDLTELSVSETGLIGSEQPNARITDSQGAGTVLRRERTSRH